MRSGRQKTKKPNTNRRNHRQIGLKKDHFEDQLNEPPSSSHPSKKRVRIKIMTIGPQQSGKTCLVKRFFGADFVAKYNPTIGVDFGSKSVSTGNPCLDVHMDLFDLSGNKIYFDIVNEFFQEIDGVLVVFDVSSQGIAGDLENIMRQYNECGGKQHIPMIFCANQIDKRQKLSDETLRQLAAERSLVYFETSAKTNYHVEEVFSCLIKKALARIPLGD